MPKMDGFKAAGILRSLGYKMPIIVTTATFLPEYEENCKKSGVNDVIIKPIKKSEIKRMLEKWLIPGEEPQDFGLMSAGSAAANISEPAVFNAKEMLNVFMVETEIALSLLSRFIERTSSQLESFPALKAAGDWATARRDSHTIKGAAGTMGSTELGKAAEALEKACLSASVKDAEAAYPHLLETFARYKQEAENLIQSIKSR
jgi:HPt (histidine-containing phosphotransfer) domain-containing protein